jgi:PAS domain-containing protein
MKVMPTDNHFETTRNRPLRDYVRKFNELSTVFNNMPVGVFAILDRRSNTATINKTAREILGLDPHSLIGKSALEVFGRYLLAGADRA